MFAGNPIGCDGNRDDSISAGDITCTVLIIFNGQGACGGLVSNGIGILIGDEDADTGSVSQARGRSCMAI